MIRESEYFYKILNFLNFKIFIAVSGIGLLCLQDVRLRAVCFYKDKCLAYMVNNTAYIGKAFKVAVPGHPSLHVLDDIYRRIVSI